MSIFNEEFNEKLNTKLIENVVKNGYLDIFKYIFELENQADTIKDYINENKNKFLFVASENGYLEMVIYLTKIGADIRFDNDYAVRIASVKGHLEVVIYLTERGANIRVLYDYAIRWALEMVILKWLNICINKDVILK